MSMQRLYPKSPQDRALFWVAIAATGLGWFVSYYVSDVFSLWIRLPFLIIPPSILVALYFIQDQPDASIGEHYSVVISDIEEIGNRLNRLAEFLKRERMRVEEAQATVNRLRNEKSQLEPVVMTQRETVNAILTAHAKTTASRVWKERAIGFISGIVTSLLATLLFEVFRR